MAAKKKKTPPKALKKARARVIPHHTPAARIAKIAQERQLVIPETQIVSAGAVSKSGKQVIVLGKLPGPPPAVGSYHNPRKRSDDTEVYSTTVHIPMELAKRLDQVRLETRIRLNQIVCEGLELWLTGWHHQQQIARGRVRTQSQRA